MPTREQFKAVIAALFSTPEWANLTQEQKRGAVEEALKNWPTLWGWISGLTTGALEFLLDSIAEFGALPFNMDAMADWFEGWWQDTFDTSLPWEQVPDGPGFAGDTR
jgi:hypothetical protein